MSYAAVVFNGVSELTIQPQARGKGRSGRGGGTVLKVAGVGDVVKTGTDVLSIVERLEAGSSLTRKQRLFSTAFVKAVARRRILEKKAAVSRFVAPKAA